jgi:hypothetical protein
MAKNPQSKFSRDATALRRAYERRDFRTVKRIIAKYPGQIDPAHDTIDMAISSLELMDFESKQLPLVRNPVFTGFTTGIGVGMGWMFGRAIAEKVGGKMKAMKNPGKAKKGEPRKIQQLRKIVREGQFGKVAGQPMDLFSASAILQVYDALNAPNKKKYASMHPIVMADMAFKLVSNPREKGYGTSCYFENPGRIKVGRRLKKNPVVSKKKKPERYWTTVGRRYSKGKSGKAKVTRLAKGLRWQKVPVELGFLPGENIKQVIRDLKIPKVTHVAVNGMGPLGFYGIRGHYKDGMAQVYIVDEGSVVVPVLSEFWRKK